MAHLAAGKVGAPAIRMDERRLACEKGEIVDDEGICQCPPPGLTVEEFNQRRQKTDLVILRKIQAQFEELQNMHQLSLKDAQKYFPRVSTKADAEKIMAKLKAFNDSAQLYITQVMTCHEKQPLPNRETLIKCLNRPQLSKQLDKLFQDVTYSCQQLTKVLKPLKTWTAAAKHAGKQILLSGVKILKKLGSLIVKYWKWIAIAFTVTQFHFSVVSVFVTKIIDRLEGVATFPHLVSSMTRAFIEGLCPYIGRGISWPFVYFLVQIIIQKPANLVSMGVKLMTKKVGWLVGMGKYLKAIGKSVQKLLKKFKQKTYIVSAILMIVLGEPLGHLIQWIATKTCAVFVTILDAADTIARTTVSAADSVVGKSDEDVQQESIMRTNVKALQALLERFNQILNMFAFGSAPAAKHFQSSVAPQTTRPAVKTVPQKAPVVEPKRNLRGSQKSKHHHSEIQAAYEKAVAAEEAKKKPATIEDAVPVKQTQQLLEDTPDPGLLMGVLNDVLNIVGFETAGPGVAKTWENQTRRQNVMTKTNLSAMITKVVAFSEQTEAFMAPFFSSKAMSMVGGYFITSMVCTMYIATTGAQSDEMVATIQSYTEKTGYNEANLVSVDRETPLSEPQAKKYFGQPTAKKVIKRPTKKPTKQSTKQSTKPKRKKTKATKRKKKR